MASHIKVGGAWKTVANYYVKVGGAWKNVVDGYIKVSGVWKKFFQSAGYTFNFGNTVYLGTNGYIAFTTGQTTISVASTTGYVLGILPADLYMNSIRWASDADNFYIFYRGRRLSGGTNYEIEYEVHIPDGQNYALIKLIAFPTPASLYSPTAFYVDGNNSGYSTVTTTRTVGSEWKVYFGSTAATSTAFTEYGSSTSGLWLAAGSPNNGSNDDGYHEIATQEGTYPPAVSNLTYSDLTTDTVTISWDAPTSATSGGSAIQSYEWSINNGVNWTSTTDTSFTRTGTYSEGTTYTVKVRANNYFFSGATNSTYWASVSFVGPNRYDVTYNANGATSGSVPTDSTSYYSGNTVTVLSNSGSLVKTGKVFGGWNTNSSGTGTTYAPGDTFTITGDTTLYAKWVDPVAPTYVTVTADWDKGYLHTNSSYYQRTGVSVSVTVDADGSPAPTYTYQWQYRYNVANAWSDYSGATSSSWTIAAGIYGGEIRCKVVATNGGGSFTGYSESSGPLVDSTIPPDTKPVAGLVGYNDISPIGGTFYWDESDQTIGVGSSYFNFSYAPTWGWSYEVYRSSTSGGTASLYDSGVIAYDGTREVACPNAGYFYILVSAYDEDGTSGTAKRYPSSGRIQFT